MNRVQFIQLSDGSQWIMKCLSPLSWLGERNIRDIEWAESIAAMVSSELSITVAAKKYDKSYLFSVQDGWILLIPYCEGRCLSHWSSRQAWLLGALLASIHQLSLPKKDAKPFPVIHIPQSNHFPHFFTPLMHQCNEHRLYALGDWVVSHRDIHQANVIWRDEETPCLIDWESAGLIHPFVELIGLAVNCAGVAQGRFVSHRFTAALAGYRQQAGSIPKTDNTLWLLSYHSWFLWLTFNKRQGNESEVQKTWNSLQVLKQQMPIMQGLYTQASDR